MEIQRSGNYGLIPVSNATHVERVLSDEARAEAALKANNQPMITGLAAHVKTCFEAAKAEKRDVEQRMLSSMRARRGEYDPEVLANIKATGGVEIFMMLSSAKARAATSVLRDIYLGNGSEKPWSASPTKIPELPQKSMDEAIARAGELIQQIQDMMGGPQAVPDSQIEELLELARARSEVEVSNEAKESMQAMERKMEDQLQEGDFVVALSEFLDDLSTFPSAILKGPVVRNKPQLSWSNTTGGYEPVVETKKTLEWERVSPFNFYPSPGASEVNEGYCVEVHELYPSSLEELIGVDGYSENAIKEVIKAHGEGGLKEWLTIDAARAEVEGKTSTSAADTTSPTVTALQFWGPVLGSQLLDWGMEKKLVKDATKTYHCEVWLIGTWVIKATLNYDPLGRRPYYKASYESIPGAFWGNSPIDLIADCQRMCNNAARALAYNISISSGPMASVNIDQLAPGEDPTSLYPWKVFQTINDPYGNNSAPVTFFQATSNAPELVGIYDKFATLADEYSGIPRYVTGEGPASGAGRTASGLSMMIGNASKVIKSVALNIDIQVISPAIERLYYYNMRYGDDPELKRTDVRIVARGAASLLVKEQAQVRRNEFLGLVLNSPVVAGIVGEESIASLLRATASGLDMDVDKLIPPAAVIKARMFQQQQQQVQQQQMALNQAAAGLDTPLEQMDIQRDANGQMSGMRVLPGKKTMSSSNQTLQDGASVTDNFAPQRGV